MHSDLLSSYEANGESFLSRIIAVDETWIHNLNRRQKDSQWNGITQLLLGRRRLPLLKQVMATVFGNKQFTAREQ
jgi:hypothetical protein